MTEIRIPVPRLPAGMGSNLLGLAGLLGIAVAVGGLTGNWWWSLLVGAVFAVGLAVVAQLSAAQEPTAEPVPAEARPRLARAPRVA